MKRDKTVNNKFLILILLLLIVFGFTTAIKISLDQDTLSTRSLFTTPNQLIYLSDAEQTLRELFKEIKDNTFSELKENLDKKEIPYFFSNVEGKITAQLNHGSIARFYAASRLENKTITYIELEIEDRAQPKKSNPLLGLSVKDLEEKKWREMSQMEEDSKALKEKGYLLLEEYKQGTYKGWDIKNQREVLVNVSPKYLKPLLPEEELQILKEVPEHPYIASLYEIGSFKYNGIGLPISYLIWEYRDVVSSFEEESFEKHYILYNRTLGQALKLANQLFEVIIHYDNTPLKEHGDFHDRNIFTDKNGDIFVIDPIKKHPFWARTKGLDAQNLAKILNSLLCALLPKYYEGTVTQLMDQENFDKLRRFIDRMEVVSANADKEALKTTFNELIDKVDKQYFNYSFYQLIQLYGSEREKQWLTKFKDDNPMRDKGTVFYFSFNPHSGITRPVWKNTLPQQLLIDYSS